MTAWDDMTEAEKIAEIRQDAAVGEAAWDDVQFLLAIIDRQTAALESLRRPHHDCVEDCWYSCPLALDENGQSECCNDDVVLRGKCTCGADAANALIDAALMKSSTK